MTVELLGALALLDKEMLRFRRVALQTVLSPIVTALLYLAVFAPFLEGRAEAPGGVGYATFIVPGLMMMSAIQNAFANSSSSLLQSKMTGNLFFVLVTPLSPVAIFSALVLAAVVRGALVALGICVAALPFVDLRLDNVGWVLVFALLGNATLGALGIIAGLWSEKFDQLAVFQGFVVTPLSFLGGVFYSVNALPPTWQKISHLNPFFYMVDGFRAGFIGHADVSPWVSLAVVSTALAGVSLLTIILLSRGWKIRT